MDKLQGLESLAANSKTFRIPLLSNAKDRWGRVACCFNDFEEGWVKAT